MAFKDAGRYAMWTQFWKKKEKDDTHRSCTAAEKSRQKCAAVELAIDVATVAAEKHCNRVSRQKHDRTKRPTCTAAGGQQRQSARVCHGSKLSTHTKNR
jgi:hypothetical protein